MVLGSTSSSGKGVCCSQSGTLPAFGSMGTGVFSTGIQQLGCEVDHSIEGSAEVKNEWSYIATPRFMACTRTTLLS
jgi:hypothetical protein